MVLTCLVLVLLQSLQSREDSGRIPSSSVCRESRESGELDHLTCTRTRPAAMDKKEKRPGYFSRCVCVRVWEMSYSQSVLEHLGVYASWVWWVSERALTVVLRIFSALHGTINSFTEYDVTEVQETRKLVVLKLYNLQDSHRPVADPNSQTIELDISQCFPDQSHPATTVGVY